MKRSTRTIVDELLQLDPSLKEHEDALVPLVEALLKADPAREPDAHFLNDLRSQLQQRAAVLYSSTSSSFSMSKFLYAFTGAAVAVVIAVPATSYFINNDDTSDSGQPLFAYQVSKTSSEAFGDLSTIATSDAGGQGGARTQSGGGGGGGAEGAPAMAPQASNVAADAYGMADEKMMIAPGEWTVYDYVYEGELPALPQDSVDVLKREKRFLNAPLSAIADRFDLGTIDLGKFGSSKLEYANFIQDKDFGYSVNLDMRNASIGIGMNWERWPQSKCQTEACWQAERVQISQVPTDDVLLKIAADFVAEYDIDVSHYGTPYVDMSWKRDYDNAPNKTQAYIPEVIRVMYPLIVEGKEVHEMYGEKTGLSIGVHIKHKRVAEAWGLSDQSFTSSAYDAVKDEQAVRDYLKSFEQPYLDPVMMRNGDIKTKTVKVTLGTPTLAYGRFYTYDNATQDELLVPSLVFPITGADDGSIIYRQYVIVPLAAEMLKNVPPQPMPLIMEDAARTDE